MLRLVPRPAGRHVRLGVLATVAVAAAAALAGCGSAAHYSGLVRKPAPEVGALSLPDATAHGAPLAFRAPERNGLLLVYFGYTLCPDVCPTTLSDIGVAVRRLAPDEQRRVSVAMVTIDPARDTPPVMAKYIRSFFRDGHGLQTGDPARLAAVAKAFGAAYRVTRQRNGTVDVVHSASTYAVDGEGRIRLQWQFGTTKRAFHDDIRTLLEHL